jgi:hypothetical protein
MHDAADLAVMRLGTEYKHPHLGLLRAGIPSDPRRRRPSLVL